MIIDKLENIQNYANISQKVTDFLKNLRPDISAGHYEISDGIYANVDIYEPKTFVNCKFEAHKKFIDIQMLLEGEERLDYTPVKGLNISEVYDEKRDVMFFENPSKLVDSVILTPYKFAFINTWEAHKPQISTGFKHVKKVVVKIPVSIL